MTADTPGWEPFGEPSDQGDPKRAFLRLLREAAAGDDDAMLHLGYCYEVGVGTRPNPAKAMLWYRRAYRKGSGSAANSIATMYREQGKGSLAFAWYLRAVLLRDDDAMHNLGYCYDTGVGTKPNPAKAMLWYRRSYRKGSSASANNIATMYRDQGKARLAFAWYLRAVLLRDGDAMVEVAKCYLHGWGVRKDLGNAAKFAQRALASEWITEAGEEEAAEILV